MNAAVKTSKPVLGDPVRGNQRIDTIDILRGFALLGVLSFNIVGFSGQSMRFDAWTSELDKIVFVFIQFFVQAKFYSLFSFLFGWGMAMQMMRAESKGKDYLPGYIRRILILLLIGTFHAILIWDGDILTDYAILGLVLILFRKRSDRFLLIAMIACLGFSVLMVAPWPWVESFRQSYAAFMEPLRSLVPGEVNYLADSYLRVTTSRLHSYLNAPGVMLYYGGNILSMFLLGFYFGRKRIFQDIPGNLQFFRWLCLFGFLIGVPLNFVFTRAWVDPAWLNPTYGRMIAIGARSFGAPALAMFYVAGIVLLLQTRAGRARLEPLAQVGRMALTNYMSHSVVFTFVFYGYGLGWYGRFAPFSGMLIVIITYLLQIRLSQWWFERFQFGPLEWGWRTLSYGRMQPFRQGVTFADLDTRREIIDAGQIIRLRHERRFFLILWGILMVWAVGLFLWKSSVQRRSEAQSSIRTALEMASLEATDEEYEDGDEGIPPEGRIQPLLLQPEIYRPGELAAMGDVYAIANRFDGEQALAQITILTAEEYGGRAAGSPEGAAVAAYLVDQFQALGLQPGAVNASYVQEFPVNYLPLTDNPILEIALPGGLVLQTIPEQDFSVVLGRYAGPGTAEGNVWWGNNCSNDDFEDINVIGDIVFCRELGEIDAARNALEHGAAALLLLIGDDSDPVGIMSPHQEIWLSSPLPTLRVTPGVAGNLLEGSGFSLGDLSLLFEPLPLQTSARVEVQAAMDGGCPESGCMGRNVIGILPGRDDRYRNEVVIIGAAMDSLGESPYGARYPGANSNASGVAVLLEIARTWQQEGFVPLRTVMFVAWDGAWQEQAGMSFYLDHPSFPLDQVIEYFHVGAVGGDDPASVFAVDAPEQILASALALDLDLSPAVEAMAEVMVFSEENVPAWGLEARDETGRVPLQAQAEDLAEYIDVARLELNGRLIDSVLLIAAESRPAIEILLTERAAALEADDEEGFWSLSLPDQRELDRRWFADAQTFDPAVVNTTSGDLVVFDGEANGLVESQIQRLDEDGELESRTLRINVRFVQVRGEWLWAGADLLQTPLSTTESSEGRTGFTLHYPADMVSDPDNLLDVLQSSYAERARLLGLPTAPDVTFMLFPNNGELRASVGYSLPRNSILDVSPGIVRVVYEDDWQNSSDFEEMLAALLLVEAGVEGEAVDWLFEGLAQVFKVADDPAAWQPALLRALQDLPEAEDEVSADTFAWARMEYLRQSRGWRGLGRFISCLGEACGGRCEDSSTVDTALQEASGMDAVTFDGAWRGYWETLLAESQLRLEAVLSNRQEAISSQDPQRFRMTVDTFIPGLLEEEMAWFDALMDHGVETYILSGEISAFLDDGSVLARVDTEFGLTGVEGRWGAGSLPQTIRFSPRQSGFAWSGVPLLVMEGDRVRILYPEGSEDAAVQILALAVEQLDIISANLGFGYSEVLTIKLYDNINNMRASIDLGQPAPAHDPTYTSAGSIMVYIGADDFSERLDGFLARSIIRSLLSRAGIESEWLVRASSAELSSMLDGRNMELEAMESLGDVVRAARQAGLLDLRDMALEAGLSEAEDGFLTAQAWSSMEYLMEQAGETILRLVISSMRRGISLEEAVELHIGEDFEGFQTAWQVSLIEGNADPAWVAMTDTFDPERALEHVSMLSEEEMAGRRMGTAGGDAAVEYIVDQFLALGLEPMGDYIVQGSTEEGGPEAVVSNTAAAGSVGQRSYLQYFPANVVQLTQAPIFEVISEADEENDRFVYREEFSLLPIHLDVPQDVTAEIVWVLDDDYAGLEFGGRIVLRDPIYAIAEEIALAEEHGAGGLILVGDHDAPRDTLARTLFAAEDLLPATIPVYEIHPEPFERLLVRAGLTRISAYQTPPALRLGFRVHLNVQQTLAEDVLAPNVLGLLPGSDPSQRDEVIILGAHFDHVGDDPAAVVCEMSVGNEPVCESIPGLRYAGENDNASGIGVLLEIARMWQETGYQPGRSILFAAWNGQEEGELGSRYYVDHPVFPLADTVAMFQLDSVGGGEGYYLETSGSLNQDSFLLYTMQSADDLVDGRLHLNYQANNNPARPRPEAFYSLFDQTGLTAVSDHLPFREEGIPTLLIRWRGADETNLPVGLADEVDVSWLDYAGRMTGMAVMLIAR